MTMIMVIAIIAAVIFAVFCMLCFVAMQRSQKEAQESSKKINKLESQLGLIGEQITFTTSKLEKKIEGVMKESVIEIDPEEKQPKIQHQQKNGQQIIEEINDDIDFEEFEIEEIGDEIDFDDFLSQYSATEKAATETPTEARPMVATPTTATPTEARPMGARPTVATPVAPVNVAPATMHFQGYNIGRSGKKYTASELIGIIEE